MIPNQTVVGFTGHRRLPSPDLIATQLRTVFDRLSSHANNLVAVSSAASGADTLFVEEISRRKIPWYLVLPFPVARFEKDFQPAEWNRIQPHFKDAIEIEQVTGQATDNQAYLETGLRTVNRATILIAVWNGQPAAGQGGTGDIVNYARGLNKSLIWIHSETGEIHTERIELPPLA